jgi:sec-independent protein translocase protein TatA
VEVFSPGHLVVLVIVLGVLFFGWKQLPDMARSAGKSMRIFKTELKGMTDDDAARNAQQAPPPPAPSAPPVLPQPLPTEVRPAEAPPKPVE